MFRSIRTISARAVCSGVLLCLSFGASADDKQLSGVKQEIARQSEQLETQKTQLNQLQSTLKSQDKRIAGYAQQLRDARADETRLGSDITQLNQALASLEQQQIAQRSLLEELLVQHYKQGQQQPLADMFSPQDRQTKDRMQAYAAALTQARASLLTDLAATETELSLKRHQLTQRQREQQQLVTSIADRHEQLQQEQKQQQTTAKKIQRQLKGSEQYLTELQANEKRLREEIKQAKIRQEQQRKAEEAARKAAEEAARQIAMNGLQDKKGQLPWPVKGKLLHKFNTPQSGQLKWKGWVIASQIGNEVKAVDDGQVVFADWLRGYGLLIMVDHGKDTMTLYGYNQSLLKGGGDKVLAGEAIALVGDSGGQTQSSLYFQISHKGQPVNPAAWLK